MTGGAISITVTLKLQPGPPATPHVTVVVPTGNKPPDAGVQVTGPHDPVSVGAKLTCLPHTALSKSVLTTMSPGQVIKQFCAQAENSEVALVS